MKIPFFMCTGERIEQSRIEKKKKEKKKESEREV